MTSLLLISGLVLQAAGPSIDCAAPSWAAELRYRALVDRHLTDALHRPDVARDQRAAQRLADRIEAERDDNARFIAETATKDCLAARLERDDHATFQAFSLIVSHSYTTADDDPALAERVRTWHGDWLERGLVDPVIYSELADRMRIVGGEEQLYGTTIACIDGLWAYDPPLADPERLGDRRSAIGWPDTPPAPIGRACRSGGPPQR